MNTPKPTITKTEIIQPVYENGTAKLIQTNELDEFVNNLIKALGEYKSLKVENERLLHDIKKWQQTAGKLNSDIIALINRS